jgi:MoxR-like ATPase
VLDAERIAELREQLHAIHIETSVARYAVALARATRELDEVSLGASPRASIYLVEGARARAALEGRSYVLPEDVKRVAPDVLRHRILLNYEAEADGRRSDDVVQEILDRVPTP